MSSLVVYNLVGAALNAGAYFAFKGSRLRVLNGFAALLSLALALFCYKLEI